MKGESKIEVHKKRQEWVGAIVRGVVAMGGLLVFYVTVLWLVTGDPEYPWQQWLKLQPWMSLLVIGFGAQVGLYSWWRRQLKARAMVVGSGMASGGAMVACCAHHVAEIVPFLGVAGIATVLTEYQRELLILGIVANGVGIGVMARRLRRL